MACNAAQPICPSTRSCKTCCKETASLRSPVFWLSCFPTSYTTPAVLNGCCFNSLHQLTLQLMAAQLVLPARKLWACAGQPATAAWQCCGWGAGKRNSRSADSPLLYLLLGSACPCPPPCRNILVHQSLVVVRPQHELQGNEPATAGVCLSHHKLVKAFAYSWQLWTGCFSASTSPKDQAPY